MLKGHFEGMAVSNLEPSTAELETGSAFSQQAATRGTKQ
jgi:hypothetical protein